MKRSRSDIGIDSGGEPALKKAKTLDDSNPSNTTSINFDNIPPEIWREVASYCADPDPMSNNGGYFATFPLLTTSKSISKAVADLPLWKFVRELKKVPIPEEEWTVKNGFADYQWNTRVVYGKTFLRMLNTVSTHLKQRRIDSAIKEHRKAIPALKQIEDFVVFDSYLNVNPAGITDLYDEYYSNVHMISTLFTLNFNALESIKLYFFGLTHAEYPTECFAQKIAVVETSHALKSLKGKNFDTLLKLLAKKLRLKVAQFREFFFTRILEFPLSEFEELRTFEGHTEDKSVTIALNQLYNDIESENYKLAADEKPHPAEEILVTVLDELHETKLFPNMPAMNLINAILRTSYKIGAKRFAEWFIEDNQLHDLIPSNFLDTVSWKFMEWRYESVAIFSIQTKDSETLTFRVESGLDGLSVGIEFGNRLASAYRPPHDRKNTPLIISYAEGIFDEVKAKCGCEKLSRDMFLSLLLAISNLDPHSTYIDKDGKIPLEIVPMSSLTDENDGTSCSEDSSDEEDSEHSEEEEGDLNEELKDLLADSEQHNKEAVEVQQ